MSQNPMLLSPDDPRRVSNMLAARGSGGLKNMIGKMNEDIKKHEVSQLLNPFSRSYDPTFATANLPSKSDTEYGHPTKGSKTEARAHEAARHIQHEVEHLLDVINKHGTVDSANSLKYLKFGTLFRLYDRISDKLVGILMRARKQGLIAFQGEMLYQRRDEEVPIYLLFYGKMSELFDEYGNPIGTSEVAFNKEGEAYRHILNGTESLSSGNSTTNKGTQGNPQSSLNHTTTSIKNTTNTSAPSSQMTTNTKQSNLAVQPPDTVGPKGRAKISQNIIRKSLNERTNALFEKLDKDATKGAITPEQPIKPPKPLTASPVDAPATKNIIQERRNSIVENLKRDAAKGAIDPAINVSPKTATSPCDPMVRKKVEIKKTIDPKIVNERKGALIENLQKDAAKGAIDGATSKSSTMNVVVELKTPKELLDKRIAPKIVDERKGAIREKLQKDAAKGAIDATDQGDNKSSSQSPEKLKGPRILRHTVAERTNALFDRLEKDAVKGVIKPSLDDIVDNKNKDTATSVDTTKLATNSSTTTVTPIHGKAPSPTKSLSSTNSTSPVNKRNTPAIDGMVDKFSSLASGTRRTSLLSRAMDVANSGDSSSMSPSPTNRTRKVSPPKKGKSARSSSSDSSTSSSSSGDSSSDSSS